MSHRVAILIREGVMPLEIGIVHQIFGSARSASDERLYEVVTCGPEPGYVRTYADFCIEVPHGPEALDDADTVIVTASHEYDDTPGGNVLDGGFGEIMTRIAPGTRIASICTGSFALAAAGILDGKRATTHWKSAERFRALFPSVELDPDVLYTDNGDVL